MKRCTSFFALTLAAAVLPAQKPTSTPPEQPATTPAPTPAKVARVSGGVMAGQLVKKVDPVYPAEARAQGITAGAVVLAVLVGEDGKVEEAKAMSGPESFRTAAVNAVHQWRYKPYLLNGRPIKVQTTVTVVFH